MDSKRLALSVVIAGSVVAAGCDSGVLFPARDFQCAPGASEPCETTEPTTADGARTVSLPATTADTTYTYVVSVISLPEATSDGVAAGFNLDNLNSGAGSTASDANCEEFNEDYVSLSDPSHVGVDNALQSLVATIESLLPREDCPGMVQAGCLDATLQGQIASGSLILLMEVGGVNDFSFDDSVTLQLYLADVEGEGMPEIGGDGALAPGQTFVNSMAIGPQVTGDIFGGRLRATADLPLQIDAGDFSLTLMISNAEVRFNISADGSSLSNGTIGGYITTESIVQAAIMIMPGIEDTVRSVVENVADIGPSSANPAVCESLSVGLTFSAVDATRT